MFMGRRTTWASSSLASKTGSRSGLGHAAKDDALHLELGHVQQVPLGDEAHLDEVLADADAGLEVGQGVVHLRLGDPAPLHQDGGEPVLEVGALGEDGVAVVEEDGPAGVLAQCPDPRGLVSIAPEKILEGQQAHGTTHL